MDWKRAIERNRDEIRLIVLGLFALAGMRQGGVLLVLRRSVLAAVMMVLRPAESAVRRLIVIAAHGLFLKPAAARGAPFALLCAAEPLARRPAFRLFDPLKRFDPDAVWDAGKTDYQSGFDWPGACAPCGGGDELLAAAGLGQRLNALLTALDSLPRQARRLARFMVRRDGALGAGRPVRLSPIRPGLPPGWRERRRHVIDPVLVECHRLALDCADTS